MNRITEKDQKHFYEIWGIGRWQTRVELGRLGLDLAVLLLVGRLRHCFIALSISCLSILCLSSEMCYFLIIFRKWHVYNNNRFTALCPRLPGEPVPKETFTHPPSWSSSNLYQLLPSTTMHSILPVQITCFAIFAQPLSTSSFCLPLGLEPSISYSINFFTQSVSSFRNKCPYHRNLFCCRPCTKWVGFNVPLNTL